MKRILSFIVIVLLIFSTSIHAQKKRDKLERQKREAIGRISQTSKNLSETTSKKSSTLSKLKALRNKMASHKKRLLQLQEDVKVLTKEIDELHLASNSLKNDVIQLKHEYASIIYASSKSFSSIDRISYLFASSNFEQMILRVKYLQQYCNYRVRQVKLIEQVENDILSKSKIIEDKREKITVILNQELNENRNLNYLKNREQVIVHHLTEKEKELKREMEDNHRSLVRLEKKIENLVLKEIEVANLNYNIKETKIKLTPENKKISSKFENNKGSVIWPVRQGFVSQGYGKCPHPILKHVTIENLGVDIQTNKNEPIRAVFDGKVTAVTNVPGMQQVIMIQHGDFFTVYAKLKNVKVKSGQKVSLKDVIGEVYTDKDNVSVLQFQVWQNNLKQDPERWLANR